MSLTSKLAEAVARVDAVALEDDQPTIEAATVVFSTEGLGETGFVDMGAFVSEFTNHLNGEVALVARMVSRGTPAVTPSELSGGAARPP